MTVEADKPRLRLGVVEMRLDGSAEPTAMRARDITLVRVNPYGGEPQIYISRVGEWFDVEGYTYDEIADIMRQS